MSDPGSNPLDYARPARPDYSKLAVQALVGLVAGILISVAFWKFGWDLVRRGDYALVALFGLPTLKLLVGLWLIFRPTARGLGVGLLLSVPVGVIIFAMIALQAASTVK